MSTVKSDGSMIVIDDAAEKDNSDDTRGGSACSHEQG